MTLYLRFIYALSIRYPYMNYLGAQLNKWGFLSAVNHIPEMW